MNMITISQYTKEEQEIIDAKGLAFLNRLKFGKEAEEAFYRKCIQYGISCPPPSPLKLYSRDEARQDFLYGDFHIFGDIDVKRVSISYDSSQGFLGGWFCLANKNLTRLVMLESFFMKKYMCIKYEKNGLKNLSSSSKGWSFDRQCEKLPEKFGFEHGILINDWLSSRA